VRTELARSEGNVNAQNYAESAGKGAAVGSLVDMLELIGSIGKYQESDKTRLDSAKLGLTIGKFIEFCDYKFEDRDEDARTLPGVKIKSQVGPLIGPIYSAEIILPITFLREIEAIREDKINEILK
jgi:hypothetical protein